MKVKRDYQLIDEHTTQQCVTSIVTIKVDGEEKVTCLTMDFGKSTGCYVSNKWGDPREGEDWEHDIASWMDGYYLGYHENGEDVRVDPNDIKGIEIDPDKLPF